MESGITCRITDLPDELLLIVFSYLAKTQLLSTIPRVCEHWHELHSDPSLYRHLVFTKDEPPTAATVELLGMAPWLRSLELTHRSDADELLRRVGADTPQLRTLVVRNCRGSPLVWNISSGLLIDIVKHCTQLRHVSLKHSKCGSRQFYKDIGLCLPLLRVIDFGYASESITTEALLNVSNNCRHVEQVLGFHYNDISADVVHVFFEGLQNTLKVVDINYALWTDSAMALLGTIPNLEALHLFNIEYITDRGLMAISHLSRLVELHLAMEHHVTPRGWSRFFIETSTRLRRLSLTHCQHVDDEVMAAIGDLENLVELTLSFVDRITAQGWLTLFGSMPARGINRLSVRFSSSLDDSVAQVIARNLTQLTKLDLLMCPEMTEEGHARVRVQLPRNCEYQS